MKQSSLFDDIDRKDFFCCECEEEVKRMKDSQKFYCETCLRELSIDETKDDISLDKVFGIRE